MAEVDKKIRDTLTYDDVLVQPAYSSVLPKDVSTQVQLTDKILLHIPLLSAAMDTVTCAPMAVSLALAGGLGVIHKNMSIEQQEEEVRQVKRSQSGMIQDPLYITTSATTGDALRLMEKYHISGIPVVDEKGYLIGIITNRDLRFEKRGSLPITEAMTINPITLNEQEDFSKAADVLQHHKIEKLPIVDGEGKLKGLITYKDILKSKNSPNACRDAYGRLCVGAAIGVSKEQLTRATQLVKADVDMLCIDTAHAHTEGVLNMIKQLRTRFPKVALMVGNIATGEAAVALADMGVDVVKVGIGPGSICTTRIVTGVGVPQLSAIMQVAHALRGRKVRIVADGGVRFSGDIVKAIVGGAHVVMLGALFAGTEEAPGDVVILQGKKYKIYRGMGSIEAMQAGAKDRYFQEHTQEVSKLVSEGVMGRVPYRGLMHEVLYQLVGGLRAGMGYCGAADLLALAKAQFIRITAASKMEGHPHDIVVTQESPNYFS